MSIILIKQSRRMNTWDAITSRRQVRSYTSDPISDAEIRGVLEAARRAPSSRNSQRWDFAVVADEDERARLSQVWQGAHWMADAPAIVAFVIAESEDKQALSDRFDIGQAAMQLMIAATGFGIASGQASCQDQELARDVLGFPEGKQCALLIALGYPGDRPLKPIVNPSRREFDDVVHFGAW